MASWKDKRKIIQCYDATADMYNERYEKEQRAKYQKALENVNLERAAVLDVGCGSGLFFNYVKAKASLIVGVDTSKKLLFKAWQQAKSSSNIFVVQADADYLPLINGFFDAAFAFTVIQNIPTPKKTLPELKRVVRFNAFIVLTGLKKAFTKDVFRDLVNDDHLRLIAFLDDIAINCYVAVLVSGLNKTTSDC